MYTCTGKDLVDPKELERVRHQLEDAQRWNASLQARLGAIQNRGGGVGGANDSGKNKTPCRFLITIIFDYWQSCVYCVHLYFMFCFSGNTLSFIGDQTSYMSICVGEGADDSLSQLSVQELKQKVNSFKEQ